jgi:hypothetical protein
MAKQRIINTKFWSDDYITNLDPLERYLFLFFLTNEHTNICGIYELPLRTMAFETGLDKEMLLKMLDRFARDEKIFYFNNCWIFVKNFMKHQSTKSQTVKVGIENGLKQVPCDILAQIKEKDTTYIQAIDTLCIPYHILEPESESELESKPKYSNEVAINPIISLFEKINPSFKRLYSNKTQRAAAERLLKQYGQEKLEKMIAALPEINATPYAPTITTPYDLETKMGKLKAWVEKQKSLKPLFIN